MELLSRSGWHSNKNMAGSQCVKETLACFFKQKRSWRDKMIADAVVPEDWVITVDGFECETHMPAAHEDSTKWQGNCAVQ